MRRFRAMREHGLDPLKPRDYRDWSELTGTTIRPDELKILIDMDAAFREALAEEIALNRQRAAEQAKTK